MCFYKTHELYIQNPYILIGNIQYIINVYLCTRTMRIFSFVDISININNKFETTDTSDIYINLLAAVSKWVFSILIMSVLRL